jgi:uncharacterized protein (UPF0335 family)
MTYPANSTGINAAHLLQFIERIEKLETDKRAIAEDIKDIYAEAKASGYDPAIMRKVVSRRSKDKAKLEEEETILDLYMNAIQLEMDLPL